MYRISAFLAVCVLALGCDRSPIVKAGPSPVGVWQSESGEGVLLVEFRGPLHIWEFWENGRFIGVNLGLESCRGTSGLWETSGDELILTIGKGESSEVVFRAKYIIEDSRMWLEFADSKQKTAWERRFEPNWVLADKQGYCGAGNVD
ncbi:MAG: hypothetical protein OXH81_21150 [Gemmatimonadetes bacterium]|nr:hypothetical protein [Gemmatimonadota bacterium]